MGEAVVVELDETVRERLIRTATSLKAQVRAVLRARIVLAAAAGLSNGAISRDLAVSVNMVRKWRGRFAASGLKGLKDAARSGRPKTYGHLVRVAVVAAATSSPPHPEATWSHRTIAAQVAHRLRHRFGFPGRPDPGRPGPQTAPGPRPAHPPRHPSFLGPCRGRVRPVPRPT
ncbi:helix-turn-helix domain-containing protein [Streptomyces sp.]|uniref:helix-turn-helix domain-containing protein n=1 Tax=Streptomyces sp. TaxID=1931 RepID=UPI0039C9C97F